MPEWRNGRRDGFKIHCPQGRVGSTPTSGIQFPRNYLRGIFFEITLVYSARMVYILIMVQARKENRITNRFRQILDP